MYIYTDFLFNNKNTLHKKLLVQVYISNKTQYNIVSNSIKFNKMTDIWHTFKG